MGNGTSNPKSGEGEEAFSPKSLLQVENQKLKLRPFTQWRLTLFLSNMSPLGYYTHYVAKGLRVSRAWSQTPGSTVKMMPYSLLSSSLINSLAQYFSSMWIPRLLGFPGEKYIYITSADKKLENCCILWPPRGDPQHMFLPSKAAFHEETSLTQEFPNVPGHRIFLLA